ncbi:MAG: DUF2961 domain-containing protein [Phycisphaerae bacterium]|jgi:hypothetical protein
MTATRAILILAAWASVSPAAELSDLATVRPEWTTHRASSFDRSGGNVDNLESFAPQTSHVLLDTDGPGRINHVWMTLAAFPNHATYLRDVVVRMYWEGSPIPSVEVPLGDFFAQGHAKRYVVESAPVVAGNNPKALNCYWPMPFYQHARIELYNNGRRSIRRIYYHVEYDLGPQPPNQGLFHALFRYERDLKTQAHSGNTTGRDNYVILETEGQGHYVGCAMFVDAPPGGWWGEGDDMIFIDHSPAPVIIGTGTEDYFNNAWGFNQAFCYPYYGCPLLEKRPDGGTATAVYRWHVPDPIRFRKHIRVTMEHIYSNRVANDYSSVAYWYQLEPIRSRPPLPFAEGNHPRFHAPAAPPPAPERFDLSATELEAELAGRGLAARAITAGLGDGYSDGGWLRIDKVESPVEVKIPVPTDGMYRVHIKPVSHVLERPLKIGFKGGPMRTFEKQPGHESRTPFLDLGPTAARNKVLTVVLEGGPTLGLDVIRVVKGPEPASQPPEKPTRREEVE